MQHSVTHRNKQELHWGGDSILKQPQNMFMLEYYALDTSDNIFLMKWRVQNAQ